MEIEDIDAKVLDWRIQLDWYPFEHFGFGAAHNFITVEIEDLELPAFFVDYEFDGPKLYVTAIF